MINNIFFSRKTKFSLAFTLILFSQTSFGYYLVVNSPNDGFLALRSSPSISYGNRLAKIPHGTLLEPRGCQPFDSSLGATVGRWCEVSYKSQIGYIFSGYTLTVTDPRKKTQSNNDRIVTLKNISDTISGSNRNHHVLVTNNSEKPICKFFASRSNIVKWEEDILGDKLLNLGNSININIDDGSGGCIYDFKTVTCDGLEFIRHRVNVCEVSTYTLH